MVKLIEEKLLMLSNLKVYRDNLQHLKYYKYILLTILLVFLISVNKVWVLFDNSWCSYIRSIINNVNLIYKLLNLTYEKIF